MDKLTRACLCLKLVLFVPPAQGEPAGKAALGRRASAMFFAVKPAQMPGGCRAIGLDHRPGNRARVRGPSGEIEAEQDLLRLAAKWRAIAGDSPAGGGAEVVLIPGVSDALIAQSNCPSAETAVTILYCDVAR
jgi:hypothetical protein